MVMVNQPVLSHELDILLRRGGRAGGGGHRRQLDEFHAWEDLQGWKMCPIWFCGMQLLGIEKKDNQKILHRRCMAEHKIDLNPVVDFPDCQIIQVPSTASVEYSSIIHIDRISWPLSNNQRPNQRDAVRAVLEVVTVRKWSLITVLHRLYVHVQRYQCHGKKFVHQ